MIDIRLFILKLLEVAMVLRMTNRIAEVGESCISVRMNDRPNFAALDVLGSRCPDVKI